MDELTNNKIEDSYFCNLIFDNLMMASVGFINTEDRSFEITPKRIKRTSDTVLTPEMKVIVTTDIHTSEPFYNGAKEIFSEKGVTSTSASHLAELAQETILGNEAKLKNMSFITTKPYWKNKSGWKS